MSVIRAVATALPAHELPQPLVRELARAHFAPAFPNIDRYLPVFEHAQIDTRSMVAPAEWFQTRRSFKECNDLFIRTAVDLGAQAAQACLDQAGLTAAAVDHLIFVSTTGMAAPSLDALLINRLGMRTHTRRTPIWGLGCAGGVGGLARAYEYTLAYPAQRAMLIGVELCSVTFQWDDLSKRNLIAASLFADGAAAVLVEGAGAPAAPERPAGAPPLPTVLGTQSTLWPDTRELMGWEMIDTGMQVVFSPRIPSIVQTLMRDNVAEFLRGYGLTLDDIGHWVLHPGGAKVLNAYQSALGIDPERLVHSREVLRRCGNMSSVTVFFVLEEFLRRGAPAPGEYAVLGVLGPGFSCELALVRG